MNVFILNTGRCGSSTFIKACKHITNFSAAHESLATKLGEKRFAYSDNHIEADNRLSWFLGRLDEKYGNDAFYVHLTRTNSEVISSFNKRENFGIMKAYKEGILLGGEESQSANNIAEDYINTIESNIHLFLKDKSNKMIFNLASASKDFKTFWQFISAEGDLNSALAEWKISYNKS